MNLNSVSHQRCTIDVPKFDDVSNLPKLDKYNESNKENIKPDNEIKIEIEQPMQKPEPNKVINDIISKIKENDKEFQFTPTVEQSFSSKGLKNYNEVAMKSEPLTKQIEESKKEPAMTKEQYEKTVSEISDLKLKMSTIIIKNIVSAPEKEKAKKERSALRLKIKQLENTLILQKNNAPDYNKLSRDQMVDDIIAFSPLVNKKFSKDDLINKSNQVIKDIHTNISLELIDACNDSTLMITNVYMSMFSIIEEYGESFANRRSTSFKGLSANVNKREKQLKMAIGVILKKHPHMIKYMNEWAILGYYSTLPVVETLMQNRAGIDVKKNI